MEKIKAFFKKLKGWFTIALNWIGIDGYAHIVTCAALTLFFCYFAPWYWAGTISMGIGIIKEIIDYFIPSHTTSIKDIICDLSGTVVGVLLYWLAAFICIL